MDSDITVGIRLLVRFSATDRYGGAGPDVDHLRRHPLARRPASYLELTGYLSTLAADVGYAVEVDELDPTVEFQPRAAQRFQRVDDPRLQSAARPSTPARSTA